MRRETKFAETPQFYEDTVERPNEGIHFEIPLFRTEQSLGFSHYSIGVSSIETLNRSSNNLKVP